MKNSICLIVLLMLISCDKPAKHKNSEIAKIELDRSGAWSDFGAAIIVDSSMNYQYCDDNLKHGNFIGVINKSIWDTLTRKLEAADYITVDSTCNMDAMDAEYFELIVYWKDKKKRMIRQAFGKKDSILKICEWLNNSYKNVKLLQIDDRIKFEGKFQNVPRPPISEAKPSPSRK